MDLLQTQFVECASTRQELLIRSYKKNTLSALQKCKSLYDIIKLVTAEENITLPCKRKSLYNCMSPDIFFENGISMQRCLSQWSNSKSCLDS
jgi:hypothetical protein